MNKLDIEAIGTVFVIDHFKVAIDYGLKKRENMENIGYTNSVKIKKEIFGIDPVMFFDFKVSFKFLGKKITNKEKKE